MRNSVNPVRTPVRLAALRPAAVRLAVVCLAAAPLTACGTQQQTPVELESNEIDEYRGEDLSDLDDFRENSIKGPQYVSLDDYRLEITGLVEQPQSLAYQEVLEFDHYSKIVTLHCVEGWQATIRWEGVLVKDLLDLAGVKEKAVTVIFKAVDGYTSSLDLEYIVQNEIILAYKMNGEEMPPERGFPFQVVAESKWGYKWVKWVEEIELSDDPDYQGFWESAGYNNDGDLEGPMFEPSK